MGGNTNGQPQQGFNPFSVFDPNGFNPFAMFNGAQNNPFGQRNIQISVNGQQFPNMNGQLPQQPQIIINNSSSPQQMPQPANNNQGMVGPNVSIQINGNTPIPNTTVEVLNPVPQSNSPKEEETSTDAKPDNGVNIGDYDLDEEDRRNWEFYRGNQYTDTTAEFNFNNGVPTNVTTNGNVHYTNHSTPNHPPHHPTIPKNPMNPMNSTIPFNINNPNNPNSPFNPNNPNNPASHFHPGNMNNPNGIFQSNLRQQQQQQQQFLRNQQMNQVHQQNTQRMNQQMHMPKPPQPLTFRKF
jgi:hypothetical protein